MLIIVWKSDNILHKYTAKAYATAMFDSHAHMIDAAFDADREALIAQLFASGVTGWIEVGTSVEASKRAIALAQTDGRIFASVGVHPHELKKMQEEDWVEIKRLLEVYEVNSPRFATPHPRPVVCAIGEVGLDFSRVVIPALIGDPSVGDPANRRAGVDSRFRGNDTVTNEIGFQGQMLRKFIELAQEKSLPVIFHVRSGVIAMDAHEELIRILKTYSDSDRPRGVIHTFSGTLAQAQQYIALGMMISFSGVVTFKNTGELPEAAKTIPIECMLVETDCPYLTPMPHRGARNDPSFLRFIIKYIADLRGASFADIERITQENANNLFCQHSVQ